MRFLFFNNFFLFFNNFRQIKHARNRIMSFRDFFLRCSEGPEWLFATKKQHQHQQLSSSSSSNQSLITKARIIWSALHLTLLHLLLALGNETTRVPFPSAFERALFLFAIVMNALAYFVVSFSSPGFVTPPLGAFSNSGSRKSGLMFADKEDHLHHHHRQREMTTMGFSSSEGGNGDEETASIRECVHCHPPVFQPIRAKHCFACNRCVRKFDHHCHWISNCVGEKNHGKFLVFLTTQFIVVAWGLLACSRTFEYYSSSNSSSGGGEVNVVGSHRKPASIAELVANNGWSCFATLLFFIFTVFVGALFFTHWYLILSARTTYELLAPRRKVWYLPQRGGGGGGHHGEFTRSPFTHGTGCQGAYMNLKRTLCVDSALANDIGVKWIVPNERVLAEREREETCLENSVYSCC